MSDIKNIQELISYLKGKGISINERIHKDALLNLGYYHAYKGCRFYYNNKNKFDLTNFSQIKAIYNFDAELKVNIYQQIMFIETALKNHTLQTIIEYGQSKSFIDLYEKCFNSYQDFLVNSDNYTYWRNEKEALKSKIRNEIEEKKKNVIISHFIDKGEEVPIWAIFEILTLGDFCLLYGCINKNLRHKISKEIKINQSFDSDSNILLYMIRALRNLRNSVAHNNFIYDNRFNQNKVSQRIGKYLQQELTIENINFKSIVDYIILISYLLKCLNVPKSEIQNFIKNFRKFANKFYNKIDSLSIYNKILPTDTKIKLTKLEQNI